MSALSDEVPRTTTGCKEYVKEAVKRMEYLKPYINEHNRLKAGLKLAYKRLDSWGK